MVIKILVGPKEKEYFEQRAVLMGWDKAEVKTVIVEEVDQCFFDMIQREPNGIEFVDTDVDFDEVRAKEDLDYQKELYSSMEDDNRENI
jgi:hypothetical protein